MSGYCLYRMCSISIVNKKALFKWFYKDVLVGRLGLLALVGNQSRRR